MISSKGNGVSADLSGSFRMPRCKQTRTLHSYQFTSRQSKTQLSAFTTYNSPPWNAPNRIIELHVITSVNLTYTSSFSKQKHLRRQSITQTDPTMPLFNFHWYTDVFEPSSRFTVMRWTMSNTDLGDMLLSSFTSRQISVDEPSRTSKQTKSTQQTQQAKQKIRDLTQRVHTLEKALTEMQSAHQALSHSKSQAQSQQLPQDPTNPTPPSIPSKHTEDEEMTVGTFIEGVAAITLISFILYGSLCGVLLMEMYMRTPRTAWYFLGGLFSKLDWVLGRGC